jgi:hypothetical protein
LQLAGDIGKTLTEEALKRTDVAIQLAKTAIVSSSPLVAAYLRNVSGSFLNFQFRYFSFIHTLRK